jgi:hypothetical protein
MGSCSRGGGELGRDGKGELLLLPSMHLLPLALCRAWGTNPLASEPLSNYSKSGTDLLFSALYSDVALPKRGASLLLDREGGDSGARYVGNLPEAASLSSSDVTCAGVRNDAGHGEPLRGQCSRREVLGEGEHKGDSVSRHRCDALRGQGALVLRTLGGCEGGLRCRSGVAARGLQS